MVIILTKKACKGVQRMCCNFKHANSQADDPKTPSQKMVKIPRKKNWNRYCKCVFGICTHFLSGLSLSIFKMFRMVCKRFSTFSDVKFKYERKRRTEKGRENVTSRKLITGFHNKAKDLVLSLFSFEKCHMSNGNACQMLTFSRKRQKGPKHSLSPGYETVLTFDSPICESEDSIRLWDKVKAFNKIALAKRETRLYPRKEKG